MKYITIITIFLSLPLFLMAEDARPNPDIFGGRAAEGITYTIKPLLKQDGPVYLLSVSGATNLPENALLDITFIYRFPGSDNERYLDYKRCQVADSAYQVQLGPFQRKPSAGQYLFKVTFDLDRQSDEVSKYLESKYKAVENLTKIEIIAIGASAEDAPKERRQMMGIIQKEGLTLKGIFDDIKEHYSKYQETLRAEDIKTLRQWSNETTGKLESLVKTILLEDELRVFEMVTQAKAVIENSAFLLKSLLQKQDGILDMKAAAESREGKEQPPKDAEEFNRKLAILNEEVTGLYKLTEKEVTKNLKELGIFSLDKDVLLGSLRKIELIINKASENEPLKDDDKSALMQEMVVLSQNLPDMFYDELHQLVAEIISVIKSDNPTTKGSPVGMAQKAKERIIMRIKTLREEIEKK